jgi:parvulin-like peptidyl-prolyl cis-trans isomerase-like protein
MRQLGLMVGVLTLAGCGALRDAFSAHPEVAGSAAGQTLTVERLADLAGRAKRVPLRPEVLTTLAGLYLDYAVFATDVARGRDFQDSALVLAAEWPTVSQMRWARYHEGAVTARVRMTRAATDSAFQAGAVRLFQHILIQVPPNTAPPEQDKRKRQAEGLQRQVAAQHGANFAELAKRYSADPGSKARGGYLPATGRGVFVPAFDSAAWRLEPGAVSDVVRSPFGFHIIRRPPLSEVRDSFKADLESARAARVDSLLLDSLARERHLEVASSAPALIRQATPQIIAARDDQRSLATYQGGAFQVKDLARWLLALDPNDVRGITSASDAQLTQFVKILAERDMLLRQVDAAHVSLTAEEWKQVRVQYDSAIGLLQQLMGISPQMLKDSAPTEQARAKLAMAHVDDYLNRALDEGKAQLFAVPPFLAGALRQGQPWSLNEAGITRALERAQAMRSPADSGARGAPPTGLKPAPGPPPVPTPPHGRQAPR